MHFLKMGHPQPLFCLFSSIQINIFTIFTTNICEKCPSSIHCWDLNSPLSVHDSPQMTTRPGLPPICFSILCSFRHQIEQTFEISYFLKNSPYVDFLLKCCTNRPLAVKLFAIQVFILSFGGGTKIFHI